MLLNIKVVSFLPLKLSTPTAPPKPEALLLTNSNLVLGSICICYNDKNNKIRIYQKEIGSYITSYITKVLASFEDYLN